MLVAPELVYWNIQGKFVNVQESGLEMPLQEYWLLVPGEQCN